MKGLLFIFALAVWILGTIGCFGYLFYYKLYIFAFAALGNGALACFTVRKLYKRLNL